jgi:hypothetical protein
MSEPETKPGRKRRIPLCIKKLAEAMHAAAEAGYSLKVEIGPTKRGEDEDKQLEGNTWADVA